MNSKKILLINLFLGFSIAIFGAQIWSKSQLRVFSSGLKTETIEKSRIENVDQENSDWRTLPFGYQIGPWPTQFEKAPIVMTMSYSKGPPEKFIPALKQIWKPTAAELTIEGPRTINSEMTIWKWQTCLLSSWTCYSEKRKLYEGTLLDLEKWKISNWKVGWFESKEIASPRGIHVQLENETTEINRYIIFTDKGITQNFTLITAKNSSGRAAIPLFNQILSNLITKDDLADARLFMKSKLQAIQLEPIKHIENASRRYLKMIEAQNLLFSQLSIDPRLLAPFFHLAGVSHLLGSALINEKEKLFENQESWIIEIHPLLKSLIQFAKDFPESTRQQKDEKEAILKNMESLLADYLNLEQRAQSKTR